MKKTLTMILVLVLALSLSLSAVAAETVLTFSGMEEGFSVTSSSQYTATDLFEDFKDVLPGDRLEQSIRIENAAEDCDYINLFLRAEVLDENGNPLTYSEVFEAIDGKDQSGIDGQRDETAASSADFLSQLTLSVYNGADLVFSGKAHLAAASAFLGMLKSGEDMTLTAVLDVPADLGNEYANRVGEVNWIFLAEAIEYEKLTVHKVWEDNNDPSRPESVTVKLLKDGQAVEEITLSEENQWTYTWQELDDRYTWTVEEILPEGYEVAYSWQDNTVFITNSNDYTPIVPPAPVELTVKKVWANDKEADRPDSVTVTLYNGETPVEKVTLSAKNNWCYTWKELDGNGQWSVLETGIPKGYVPSYKTVEDVVTITNTAKLIQTGQIQWPIPVLGGLGILMLLLGAILLLRRKKSDA